MENIIDMTEFKEIPVIPLRGIVLFPKMTLHFDVGRKKSISALKYAMNKDQRIMLIAQRDASIDNPKMDDMFEIGVICEIKQLVRLPNSNNLRVVVEGINRASLITIMQEKPFLVGVADTTIDEIKSTATPRDIAYSRAVKSEFETYASNFSKISNEVISKIISITDISELADYICANSFFDYTEKQKILEEYNVSKRIAAVLALLKRENETLNLEAEIQAKVQREIDKGQREYFLREEMKVISDELGETDNPVEEADEYKQKIAQLMCSADLQAHALVGDVHSAQLEANKAVHAVDWRHGKTDGVLPHDVGQACRLPSVEIGRIPVESAELDACERNVVVENAAKLDAERRLGVDHVERTELDTAETAVDHVRKRADLDSRHIPR